MAKKAKTNADDKTEATNAIAAMFEKPAEIVFEQDVRLDELTDGTGDRIRVDKDSIESLARSIETSGLLNPIIITAIEGKKDLYRIVAGRRRVAAHELLNRTTIRAVCKAYASEDQILRDQETENIQRENLNYLEEAIAVMRLLDLEADRAMQSARSAGVGNTDGTLGGWGPVFSGCHPEQRTIIAAAVAYKLGKNVSWVNDRALVATLPKMTRDLVLDGRLPLTHAREIAKVVDPNMQDQIADLVCAGVDPAAEPAVGIDEVRQHVRQNLFSLAQAPWLLDVPFGGAPRCDTCPSNSANRPGLFEHFTGFSSDVRDSRLSVHGTPRDKNEPDAGVCTNHVCFKKKNEFARAALARSADKIVKKIEDLPKKERPAKLTPATVNKALASEDSEGHSKPFAPEFLKTSAVTTRAQDKIENRRARSRSTGGAPRGVVNKPPSRAQQAKQAAQNEYDDLAAEWANKLNDAIDEALKGDPERRLAVMIAIESKLIRDSRRYGASVAANTKIVKCAGMTRLLSVIREPTLKGIAELALDAHIHNSIIDADDDVETGLAVKLAEAIGIDIEKAAGKQPDLEALVKKHLAEAKAGKAAEDGAA